MRNPWKQFDKEKIDKEFRNNGQWTNGNVFCGGKCVTCSLREWHILNCRSMFGPSKQNDKVGEPHSKEIY